MLIVNTPVCPSCGKCVLMKSAAAHSRAERIFPLVATCGRAMDEAFLGRGDMLLVGLMSCGRIGAGSATPRRRDRADRAAPTKLLHTRCGSATLWREGLVQSSSPARKPSGRGAGR